MADVNGRPLSTIFLKGHGDQRRFLRTARKQKSYILEEPSKLQAVQPDLQPWEGDEQINLGTISLTHGVKQGDWE